jgi:OOP family OmpA-OmpF porin
MKKIILSAVMLLVTLAATTGYSQVRAGSVNVTPTIGYYVFEGNEDMDAMPNAGLRLGYNFTKYIGIEGYGYFGQSEVNSLLAKPKVDVTGYGVEGIFNLLPNQKLVPYLAVGVGGIHYSAAYEDTTGDKKNKFTADYGYGVKYYLSDDFALRMDIRHVMPFSDMHSNMLISFGLNFVFGGAKKAAPVSAPEPVVEEVKPQAAAAPVVEEVKPQPAAPVVVEEGKRQPASRVAEEIKEKGRVTLEVLFDTNKSIIKKNYTKDIDNLADVMKGQSDMNVTIEGHTDNVGSAAFNKKLSQNRANAVKKYLIEKGGVNAKQLKAVGYGLTKPVASNKTKEGRAKNRRVEAAVDHAVTTDKASDTGKKVDVKKKPVKKVKKAKKVENKVKEAAPAK